MTEEIKPVVAVNTIEEFEALPEHQKSAISNVVTMMLIGELTEEYEVTLTDVQETILNERAGELNTVFAKGQLEMAEGLLVELMDQKMHAAISFMVGSMKTINNQN
jgi:hypothetical protein